MVMSTKERESHFHRLPGQRLPKERLTPEGVDFEEIKKAVKTTFAQDDSLLNLFNAKRDYFLDFFLGVRDIELGRGREMFDLVVKKYHMDDMNLRENHPVRQGEPITKLIRAEAHKLYERKRIAQALRPRLS